MILPCPDSFIINSATRDKEFQSLPHSPYSARGNPGTRNLVVDETSDTGGDKDLEQVTHSPYSARANVPNRNPSVLEASNEAVHRDLLNLMVRGCTHRGSDVRLATSMLQSPAVWPRTSIEVSWWKWRIVMYYPLEGRHINAHELLALVQSVKWRSRRPEEIGMKCVHAVDSQVVLAVVVKGSSSSFQLHHILKKLNCLLIASGIKLCLAYVSTEQNPADRPSRWRHNKDKYKIWGRKPY